MDQMKISIPFKSSNEETDIPLHEYYWLYIFFPRVIAWKTTAQPKY